jgi:hypothetical protein
VPRLFPAHPDGRRLLLLALSLALLLGSVAAFNCTWDPYGKFRARPANLVFGPATNYPLFSMLELNRLAPARREAEVLLVGDSRAWQLTPRRVATVRGHRVLNIAVPGASFEEALSILTLEGPRLPAARLLVVAAPLERFAERPSPDRCREAWPVAQSFLRYTLNWQTCEDSWKMAAYLRRGAILTPHVYTGRKEDQGASDQLLVDYWRGMFQAYDPARAKARLELLRETLAPWLARGARVIFWAPPLRKDLQGFIPENGLDEVWQALAGEMRRMGPVVDLKYEAGLPGLTFTFKDPVHVAEGGAVLERLLQEYRD